MKRLSILNSHLRLSSSDSCAITRVAAKQTSSTLPHDAGGGQNQRVVSIGACVLDVNAKALDGHKLIQGGSVPGHVTQAMGGVARNVADGVARLAHEVPLLVSAVGDDAAGRAITSHWAQLADDDTQAIRRCTEDNTPTATVSAVFSADGELVACIADADAAAAAVTPAWIERFAPSLRIAGAVICDCNITPLALQAIATTAPRGRLWLEPTSMAKCRRATAILPHVTVVSPNEDELHALAASLGGSAYDGSGGGGGGDMQETARRLAGGARTLLRAGVSYVVVTIGADGVLLYASSYSSTTSAPPLRCYHVPAVPVSRVVGVSGAGDALAAGALAVLSQRSAPWTPDDVLDGLALGVVVASEVVSREGTHVPAERGAAGDKLRERWYSAARDVRTRCDTLSLPL